MIQQERFRIILDLLHDNEVVKVSHLMELFGVSIETVRRDLEALEKKKELVRVYGGAILPTKKAAEPAFGIRKAKNSAEKRRIGRRAIELIQDGDVIAIDHGTTTYELAKALVGKRKVTVITASVNIAAVLAEDPNITVIIIGGTVRGGDLSVSGSLAERNISEFCSDKFFMGVGGLTEENGVTDFHLGEASVRRAAIRNTQKVIALVDNSKFGVSVMNRICDLKQINTLVTDAETDPDMIQLLKDAGVEVHIAE